MIDALETGVTGAGATMSLETAWLRARDRMRRRGSPEPQQFAQNTVARQIRFYNRAARSHTTTLQNLGAPGHEQPSASPTTWSRRDREMTTQPVATPTSPTKKLEEAEGPKTSDNRPSRPTLSQPTTKVGPPTTPGPGNSVLHWVAGLTATALLGLLLYSVNEPFSTLISRWLNSGGIVGAQGGDCAADIADPDERPKWVQVPCWSAAAKYTVTTERLENGVCQALPDGAPHDFLCFVPRD
ncbi:hypothetical protein ACWDSL_18805 [Streptomyces sp. NPDC000941]